MAPKTARVTLANGAQMYPKIAESTTPLPNRYVLRAITGLIGIGVGWWSGVAPAQALCSGPVPGAYRTVAGDVIVLNYVAKPRGFRWTHQDGRTGGLNDDGLHGINRVTGWTKRPDVTALDLLGCEGTSIRFEGGLAKRVELIVEHAVVDVDGAKLAGQLVRPSMARDGAVPLVIDLQGSGRGSYLESSHRQFLLPALGVAVFLYDKRGTGRSTGKYTQDIHVLAADAAAAFRHAARMVVLSDARQGFIGSSQGGWVAPLAAKKVGADFVVVNYGLAYSALQEDREQVMSTLKHAGWENPIVLKKAADVAAAAGRVVTHKTDAAMRDMERLRDLYGQEAWWKDLGGEFTSFIANTPAEKLVSMAPAMEVGTSWEYDPMPTLRGLSVPQLWLIAEQDLEAPPAETLQRLRMLQNEGKPLTIVSFPNTDHGIRSFEIENGKRVETRYAPGSQRIIADWILGKAVAPSQDEEFSVEKRH
jgi:pimeloyl-ACP methyl ester carboxylesterase